MSERGERERAKEIVWYRSCLADSSSLRVVEVVNMLSEVDLSMVTPVIQLTAPALGHFTARHAQPCLHSAQSLMPPLTSPAWG